MKKFTEESALAEALKHPKAEEILTKYKMPCLWCPMAKQEAQYLKLGQICQIYQINIKKLLEELNNE